MSKRKFLTHKGAILLASIMNRHLRNQFKIEPFQILDLQDEINNTDFEVFEYNIPASQCKSGEAQVVRLQEDWFDFETDEVTA